MKNEIHRKTRDGELPTYTVRESYDAYQVGFKEGPYFQTICEVTDEDDVWEICDALNARHNPPEVAE